MISYCPTKVPDSDPSPGKTDPKPKTVRRIFLLVLLIAFMPGMLVQAILHFQRFNAVQVREMQSHRDFARAVALVFRGAIEDVSQDAQNIGQDMLHFRPDDQKESSRFLSVPLKRLPFATEIAWLSPDGSVVASSSGNHFGEDRKSEGYFAKLGRACPWVLGSVRPHRKTGAAAFTVAHTVNDKNGRYRGVLAISIDAERFADTRLRIHRTQDVTQDAGFILLDDKGVAAFRRPYFPFPDWQHRDFSREEYVSSALQGREAGGKLELPMTGKAWFTARTPVPDLGWVAGAGQEYERVMAPLWRDLGIGVGLSILCLLLSGGIALRYGRMILTDLGGLHDSVTAWGKSQKTSSAKVRNVLELRDIASAFETVDMQRTEAEKALSESEEEYRSLFANLNSAALLVEPTLDENGRLIDLHYLMANAAVEKHLGKTRDELVGKLYSDVFRSPRENPVFDFCEKVLVSGEPFKAEILLPALNRYYDLSVYRPDAGRLALIMSDITERKRAEEALRQSEERFRQVADSLPQLVWTAGPDGKVDYVNAYYREYVGLTSDGVPEMFSLIHPDDLKRCEEAWYHSTKTGEIYDVENRARRHDGEYRWFLTRGIPIRDNGRVIRWFGSATDIHDLRQLQNELETRVKERTDKLRAASLYSRSLIEASIDPLVTISPDGKIMDVNCASEAATGVAREQLIGSDFSDYFVEPEKARAGYEEVFRKGSVRDYPLELKHRDGNATPVLYNATVYRDETGKIMGVFAAARDITERKQAEKAMKVERQRLFDVLETLPAMICLLTPDYHVAFENKSFREKFGESQGRRCYEYCFGRTQPCEFCESFRVLETGKPHHWEVTTPDGSVIEAHDFPFTDADGSRLILEMDVDITDFRKAEEEMRAAHRKLRAMASEMVRTEERERQHMATILHDTVAQTLAATKMRLEAIQDHVSSPGLEPMTEARKLLTQSIRETRSIMAELSPPVLNEIGFVPALEWLAEQFTEQHRIPVKFDSAGGFQQLPHDVEVLLYQGTRELLLNIVKHAKAGKAAVMVFGKSSNVRIEVSDDGVGFDKAKIGYQGDLSGGFGLFSIRERLKHFGGELKIQSHRGKETQITMIVPRGEVSPKA